MMDRVKEIPSLEELDERWREIQAGYRERFGEELGNHLIEMMVATKVPWIGVLGRFDDPRWAQANTIEWKYLEYEPLDYPQG